MAAGTRAALRTGDVGSLGAAGAESFDGIAQIAKLPLRLLQRPLRRLSPLL